MVSPRRWFGHALRLLTLCALIATVGLTVAPVASAQGSGAQIIIANTDTQTIANLRVSARFTTSGAQHFDFEDHGTFDRTINDALSGQNGTWDGSQYTGNFLALQSSAAGNKLLTITKTDTRAFTNLRLTVDFTVNGAPHTDFEDIADVSGTTNFILNSADGTWDGTKWIGNFLRPGAAPTATSYEAEAGSSTLAGTATRTNCGACSAGQKVGNIGGSGTVQLNGVTVGSTGRYTLRISYTSGDPRNADISINGGSAARLDFASTGGWETVGARYADVTLNAGSNTIRFSNTGGYAPDLDRIDVITLRTASLINLSNGNVRVEYDLANGIANFYWQGAKKLANFYSSVRLASVISSRDYDTRSYATNGAETVVTSSGNGLPTMKQRFMLDNADRFLVQVEVNGSALSSNLMAPLVMDTTGGGDIGSYSDVRALRVPFDNDSWDRYRANPINSVDTSYEVAAFYDNTGRNGMVIGSVTHDTWKSGVEYSGANNRLNALKVYGGVANNSTRDVLGHGSVTGNTLLSPKVMVGFYPDWRSGMEAYADANTAQVARRTWSGGVPFGWNSWGRIQSSLNYDKAVAVSDFVKNNLQDANFSNNSTVYINLDSYWDNLSDTELQNFVNRVRANSQKAGIYWAPFVYWGGDLTIQVEGTNGQYRYSDAVLRDFNGNVLPKLDGAYALDPTHPATRARMAYRLGQFRTWGYEYVKVDFLTHGAREGGSQNGLHYDSSIKTGIQAYNQGMQYVLDQVGSTMFVSQAISPLFPYQYAHARRVSCDVYGSMSGDGDQNTSYLMNSVTYGWWMHDKLYAYNDPDHIVFEGYSANENKSRVVSAAIAGTVFLAGDDLSREPGQSLSRTYLTNDRINSVARLGRTFRPVEGNTGNAGADVFVLQNGTTTYLAVFNYSGSSVTKTINLARAGLNGTTTYSVTDLWSNAATTATGNLVVTLGPAESTLVRLN